MGVYSSSKAIAIHDKKILVYLRDNKPEISDPNKWDLPGSDLLPEETYENAVKRSFKEQFAIIPKDVSSIGKVKNEYGIEHGLFLIRLSTDEINKLHFQNKGQKYRFLSFEELMKIDLTPPLFKYLTKNKNKLIKLVST